MNPLVAKVCVTVCSGGQQTARQLIRSRRRKKNARWQAFAVFTAIAGTAAPSDVCVCTGEEPAMVGPRSGGIH